jgi:uncharacterized membrane protein
MGGPVNPKPGARLPYLDLTKGVLVILMVVYHSLNYTSEYQLSFRYLSFLPPSFILITGFILSHIYARKYDPLDRSLTRRLVVRGVKLFALFTLLNVVAQYTRSPVYGQAVGISTLIRNWDETFLIGSGKVAVFEVLLPISYLLVISPWLLRIAHRHSSFLLLLTVVLIGTCTYFDRRGESLLNLNLLTAGVLGMLIGQNLTSPFFLKRLAPFALVAYCIYIPFGRQLSYMYLIQLIAACTVLAAVAGICMRFTAESCWERRVLRLGQYSLLAYIVQIGVLQLASRFIGRPDPLSVLAAGSFLVTLIATSASVEFTRWMTVRSTSADRLYRAVFA